VDLDCILLVAFSSFGTDTTTSPSAIYLPSASADVDGYVKNADGIKLGMKTWGSMVDKLNGRHVPRSTGNVGYELHCACRPHHSESASLARTCYGRSEPTVHIFRWPSLPPCPTRWQIMKCRLGDAHIFRTHKNGELEPALEMLKLMSVGTQ